MQTVYTVYTNPRTKTFPMSGRHPWTDLLKRTYTPQERAAISADGDKIVADNRRRQALRKRRRDTAVPHRERADPDR